MAQHDYDIANQNGAAFRADLNSALEAVQSQNSGATEPTSTVAYMPWADTNAGLWKVRNAADSAWVSLMSLTASRVDTATGTSYDNASSGLSATNVKDAIDEIVTTAAFEKATTEQAEAGTDDASYMTPLKTKQAIDANAALPIGSTFAIWDHLPGSQKPSNDGTAKYIKLTAGEDGVGGFNEGLLTGETITGAAPLLVATAEIAVGPMAGGIIHLRNTERTFSRAGSSGVLQEDAFQGHWHEGTISGSASGGSAARPVTAGSASNPDLIINNLVADPISDGTNGEPRTDAETRPRNVGETIYMRIA